MSSKLGLGPQNTIEGDKIFFAPSYSALLIVRRFTLENLVESGIQADFRLIGACYVGNESFWKSKLHDLANTSPQDWIFQSEIDEAIIGDDVRVKIPSRFATQGSPAALQSSHFDSKTLATLLFPGIKFYRGVEDFRAADKMGTRHIMFWKCACEYQGVDLYLEQRPGAMRELLEVFQKHGIRAFTKTCDPSRPKPASILLVRLLMSIENLRISLRNKEWASLVTMRQGRHSDTVSDRRLSSKTATGSTSGASSSRQGTNMNSLGSNQQVQSSTGAAKSTLASIAQPSQPSPSSAIYTQVNTANVNIREDFILLCMKVKRFLTNRHDLQVSTMTRDRELFEAFRNEYRSKFGWAYCQFSFQTVQRINFIKFTLHPRFEVDGIVTDMPPDTAGHYTCEPRSPGLVPPLGSDLLMHRFSSPRNCFQDDICLRQFPKRVGERPTPGIDPDFYTAWGMHLEQGYDLGRICLVLFFGMASGGLVGLLVGIFRSVQDGFSIASFIVGTEAVAIATLQALLTVAAM